MATVKGIEVSGTTYDIEDETSRNGVTANEEAIGDLSDLETTVKTDLVSAINELANGGSEIPKVIAPSFYNNTNHDLTFNEDEPALLTTATIQTQLQAFGGDLVNGRTYLIEAIYANGSAWKTSAFTYSETNGWTAANSITGSSDIMSATSTGISFEKSGSTTITIRAIIIG